MRGSLPSGGGAYLTSSPRLLRAKRSWGMNRNGKAEEQDTALQTRTLGAVR